MSDDKQGGNPMGKYERKVYHALPNKPEQAANEPPGEYQGIEQAKGGKAIGWIQVITADAIIYGVGYSQIIEWVFTPPSTITVLTSTRLFIIEGTNIERLIKSLQERKLTTIREFNEALHLKPKEEDAVFIESISIQQQG